MATDRGALLSGWTGEIIRVTCLAQGWDSGEWEYAVTFGPVPGPAGPVLGWHVLLSLDSGLAGRPPLVTTVTVPGARPGKPQMSDAVVGAMGRAWAARLARSGVAAAPELGTGKMRAVGPASRLPQARNGHGRRG